MMEKEHKAETASAARSSRHGLPAANAAAPVLSAIIADNVFRSASMLRLLPINPEFRASPPVQPVQFMLRTFWNS